MGITELLKEIKKLSQSEIELLKSLLADKVQFEGSLDEFVTENRFSNNYFCPRCNSKHIVRNGHKGITQRFLCHDCHKTFTIKTNTITASTKKSFSVWSRYFDCMMDSLSLRRTAEACGISLSTAFIWRHKILDALQNMANSVKLNGIIEGDETFFPVSYKGNHNNDDFEMPRESHKRGKSTHKRGLSREKVCVPCAVNRNGLSISVITNLGRVSTKDLHKAFDGRIEELSTLVTDEMNAYKEFALSNNLELIQLKSGKRKYGIYHIQHINAYHSVMKHFVNKFKGVSTKYLSNYLVWNNLLNYSKGSYQDKRTSLMTFTLTTKKTVLCKELSSRPELPF